MKITRLCFRTVFAGTILAAFTWPASCRADELEIRGGSSGEFDFFHPFFGQSTTASSLSGSYSGAHGSASASISYGSLALSIHSASDSNGNGSDYSSGDTNSAGGAVDNYWLETITINNPGLTGTAGTAEFTYNFNGSFSDPANLSSSGLTGWGVSLMSKSYLYGYSAGNISSMSAMPSTLTDDVPFTFGTPFQVTIGMSASGDTNFARSATVDASMSLRETGMSVLVGGHTAAFTSTENAGSGGAVNVSSGASYSGFTLTNTSPYGHGSTASILGGVASADSVVEAKFLAQAAGFTQASDIVDLSGVGHDKYVMQLSYDPSIAASLFGSEANATLLWLDPVSGLFENAVSGNSDGGAASQAFSGAYNPATESALGDYGVDTTNHVVWAVVDHNSEFAVGLQAAPEPGTWATLLGGIGVLVLRRRRRAI